CALSRRTACRQSGSHPRPTECVAFCGNVHHRALAGVVRGGIRSYGRVRPGGTRARRVPGHLVGAGGAGMTVAMPPIERAGASALRDELSDAVWREALVHRDSRDSVLMLDLECQVLFWNTTLEALSDCSRAR